MSGRKFDIDGANELLAEKSIGQWIGEGFKQIADSLKTAKKTGRPTLTRHRVSLNLISTKYSPKTVRKTRDLLGCSQSIFARFLGVSISTVRNWEQGVNEPEHVARRLMDEIRHDPVYWKKRLRALTTPKASKIGSK
jgi:putative transcriptional regulator